MMKIRGQQKTQRRSPSRVLVISRVSLYHCLDHPFRRCLLRYLHPTLPPPLLLPRLPPHLNNLSFSYNHHNVPPDPPNAHSTSRVRVRRLAIRTNDISLSGGGISGREGIRRGVMCSWLHLPKAQIQTQRMQIRRNSPPRARLRPVKLRRLLRYRPLRDVRVLLGLHHLLLLLPLDRKQNTLFLYHRRNQSPGLYIP